MYEVQGTLTCPPTPPHPNPKTKSNTQKRSKTHVRFSCRRHIHDIYVYMIRIWHLSPFFIYSANFLKNGYLPYASCGCFLARWQMSRLRMGSYDRSSDMSDDVGVHGVVLGVLSHLQMGVPTHELAFTRIANHLLSGMILQVVIQVVDVSIDHVLWIWLRITTDKYHVYQFLGDEHPFVSPFNVSTRATGF